MGEAAEKGLDQVDSHLVTQGIRGVVWELQGGTEMTPGVLKAGYSRDAVWETLGTLIHDNRFQRVVVWVKVDGISVAVGGFHQ